MKINAAAVFIIAILNCTNTTAQTPAILKEVFSTSTNDFANYLEFSKDGNYLVSVVGFNADVYHKKEKEFKLIQTLTGTGGQAAYPGISEDGTYISFSAWDNTYIYKREGELYSLLQTIHPPGNNPRSDMIIRFTGNNKLLIVGNKGNIRFYDLKGNIFSETKIVDNPSGLDFHNAALSPDGMELATIDDKGDISCWHIAEGNVFMGKPVLKTNKYQGMLDISNEKLLVAGTPDSLSIYQLSSNLNNIVPVHTFLNSPFTQVKFNQEGNKVMVTNDKGTLDLYSISGNIVRQEYANKACNNKLTDMEMCTGGQWIAATSMSGKQIIIYEYPAYLAASNTTTASIKNKNIKAKGMQPAPVKANTKTTIESNKLGAITKNDKTTASIKNKYTENTVAILDDYIIFEAGKKYGIKKSVLSEDHLLKAKYDTIIGLRLSENNKSKSVFIVIDHSGLQVFRPHDYFNFINTTEKLVEYIYSNEYLYVKTEKGRWNPYNESITATTGYMKVQLLYNSIIFFPSATSIKVEAWNKYHGYHGEEYNVPDGAEVIHFGEPGDFIYKVKDKVGYTNSKMSIFLPALFDDIKMGYGNIVQLKYRGRIYYSTWDDIRTPRFSSTCLIKAKTFGSSCGRSDCNNGTLGMSTQTTGGKVEKKQYEKLTLTGRILVISTYVTPVKTISTPKLCSDKIHETKRFVLEVNSKDVNVIEL